MKLLFSKRSNSREFARFETVRITYLNGNKRQSDSANYSARALCGKREHRERVLVHGTKWTKGNLKVGRVTTRASRCRAKIFIWKIFHEFSPGAVRITFWFPVGRNNGQIRDGARAFQREFKGSGKL